MKDWKEQLREDYGLDDVAGVYYKGYSLGHQMDDLEHYISKLLSSQMKEVLGVIESKKVSEMSASEYNEVVLTKDTPQHKNLRHRLTGSHNPSWITAEIYNLALDDIKAELEKEDR